MPAHRVLVVRPPSRDPGGPPPPERLSDESSIVAEAVPTVQEAIRKLTESGYSAVVCWAERQDELAGLIRIRKSKPEVPVLLLTPQSDDTFSTLARQLGATVVLRPEPDHERTAELLRTTILTGRLEVMQSQVAQGRKHARDLHTLAQSNRALTRSVSRQLRTPPRPSFSPLVVEGEPEAAFRMVRAMEKADVFSPIPILRGTEEAIHYLDDLSRPQTRAYKTMPSVLLVDSELPEDGALRILRHVRSLPPFAALPVIFLGPPGQGGPRPAVYESGANSYVERPAEIDALARCVASLKSYWGSLNHGSDSF